MKKLLLLALALLCSCGIWAREDAKGNIRLDAGKYELQLPEGRVHFLNEAQKMIIQFRPGLSKDQVIGLLRASGQFREYDKSWEVPFPRVIRAELRPGKRYEEVSAQLERNADVLYTAPVLQYHGLDQSLYDLFYVKLKTEADLPYLRELADQLHFRIEREYQKNTYFCRTDKHAAGNSFELSVWLQSLHRFVFAEPDFIYTCSPATTDPSYNLQWAIHNTGQFSGTPGADMNVENAWNITTGSSSIKVAIIDCFGSAAQFTHPDINFFATYDATGTGFNSSGFTGDAHGICCAGIIRATGNNTSGGAGVAYSANVIAVKVGTIVNSSGNWNSTGNSISDGISWAYQNADVISNSNSYGSSSSIINTAISNGLTLGRAGKGTLFFSSAGNSNTTSMGYPASYASTVAVGASSMCDERKSPSSCDGESFWGGNYSTGLDVSAPGVHIYTTDLPGTAGYSSTDFIETFNGTSSACPMAAAVMALILSANPGLTAADARYALESTCSKVGGYTYSAVGASQPNGTWSNELGYGRVNAYQAVLAVGTTCSGTPVAGTITGPSAVCATTPFNLAATGMSGGLGITYQWQSSPGGTANWSAIAGATNNSYAAGSGIAAATDYRLVITCTNGGGQSISNTLSVALTPAGQCYCTASVNTQDELITNVTVANINNTNTGFGNSGYQDFTNITGNLVLGSSYAFSAGIAPYYNTDAVAVWIDLNQDGIFANPGERLLLSTPAASPATGTIAIPVTALTGTTRMRVRLDYGNNNPAPCGGTTYGNIEDYSINISCTSPTVSITADALSVCAGTAVHFTATPVNGGATPAYQWKVNGTAVPGATAATYTASFSTSSTVAVIMTPTVACPGAPTVQSNTLSISVSPMVTPSVSISASATSISPGTSVTFTATPANPGAGPQYQWKKNGANVGTNNNTYTNSSLVNGDNISCALTSNAACLTTPSANSNTVTMTVSGNCTASVSAGGPTTFCPGGSVLLSANAGNSYLWSNGATTQNISVTQSGSYSVTVTTGGCSASSASVQVTVKSIPTIKIKNLSSLTICDGTTVDLVLDPLINTSGFSYQWNKNGVAITGATTNAYAAGQSGAYTLTVLDGIGCSKTSASKSVVVNPSPVASFTASGPTSFCTGGSVTLNAAVVSGYTYKWLKNGASAGTAASLSVTSTGNYTVVAKLNTCADTAAILPVTVYALPASAITTSSPTTFCSGGSALLQANPSGSGYTYAWQRGTTVLAGATNASYSATQSGNYKVLIANPGGCQKLSPAFSITVETTPVATITALTATTFGPGGSAQLRASNGTGYTWQWYRNATVLSGATLRDYFATQGGSYTVVVTKGNCSATSTAMTVTQTGAKQPEAGSFLPETEVFELLAYPSPVSTELTIELRGITADKATVRVMDISGRQAVVKDMTGNTTTIDMSPFPAGVYFVWYKDGQRTASARVTKQ